MKIQVLRYFFLFASFLLLLGHAFVPHRHEAAGKQAHLAPHRAESSWLQALYALDLGQNHLNDYRQAAATHSKAQCKTIGTASFAFLPPSARAFKALGRPVALPRIGLAPPARLLSACLGKGNIWRAPPTCLRRA